MFFLVLFSLKEIFRGKFGKKLGKPSGNIGPVVKSSYHVDGKYFFTVIFFGMDLGKAKKAQLRCRICTLSRCTRSRRSGWPRP